MCVMWATVEKDTELIIKFLITLKENVLGNHVLYIKYRSLRLLRS